MYCVAVMVTVMQSLCTRTGLRIGQYDTSPQKFISVIQVRIQDLVKGGAQLPKPKVADVAECSRMSEATYLWPLKGPGSF